MTSEQRETRHYHAYPQGSIPAFLAYGFRPFFLLAPIYLVINMLLWSAMWAGLITLNFTGNWLEWHIYELLFGVTSAMMIGFILTAVPELMDEVMPIVGKPLLGLVLLWILGRVSFWLMDWLGVLWVALTNIPLLLIVVGLVVKPILADPLKRQYSLLAMFMLVSVTQALYFAAKLNVLALDSFMLLKFSVGVFMMLVLVAVRLITMRGINEWMEQKGIDDVFYARKPFYNIAILAVFIYSIAEYLVPNNSLLVWLAFAAMAGILSTLSDFFNTDTSIVTRPFIWPLFMILVLLATGYGLIGFSGLLNEFVALNHFRHLLTMGALGLAYYVVLVIVVHTHTGRDLIDNNWIGFGGLLILFATVLRGIAIPIWPEYTAHLYSLSALIWALPYLGFVILFHRWLLTPRVDGLKG